MGAGIPAPQSLGLGPTRVHSGRNHPGGPPAVPDAPYAALVAPLMATDAAFAASCSVFDDRWEYLSVTLLSL